MENPREQRGLEIAAKAKLQQSGNRWFVPSQSGNVTSSGGGFYIFNPRSRTRPSDPLCCPQIRL
jgi:hypothetical protein